MKVKKIPTDKFIAVEINLSYADIVEADLLTAFGMNTWQKPVIVQSGRLDNYLTRQLLAEAYEEDDDIALVAHQRPIYKIVGDADLFITAYITMPRQAAVKSGKSFKPFFDKADGDGFQKFDETWQVSNEARMKAKRG